MSIEDVFRTAVELATHRTEDPERNYPSVLAKAVSRVLPVDGVCISVQAADGHRVALGADGEDGAFVEASQFTIGDGPCLQAMRTHTLIDMSWPLIRNRWPALAGLWAKHTPFRSVTSAPFHLAGTTRGALNLLFSIEHGGPQLIPAHLAVAVALTAAYLDEWVASGAAAPSNLWNAPPNFRRGDVWVAVAALMTHDITLAESDVLAVLRAYAFANELTVDEVANRLVNGGQRPGEILDQA